MGLKPLYWRFLSGLGLKSRGNSFFPIQKLLLPRIKVTGYLSFQNKLLIQHRGHRDGAEAPLLEISFWPRTKVARQFILSNSKIIIAPRSEERRVGAEYRTKVTPD